MGRQAVTRRFRVSASPADIAGGSGAWLHTAHRQLVAGADRADSWATEAHKWLNVPYDSGLAFCAHPEAHQAAMGVRASYLVQSDSDGPRDEVDWTPEFSRRARGFAIYAAIRSLGRSGIAELVERSCTHARRFATGLAQSSDIEVLNDVVLNQVLVRFLARDGDHDARTRAVIQSVQDDGACWLSGTRRHGMGAMRISVSNWSTTSDDVGRSIEAILRAVRDAAT
jgi:glutamate/tyrosine decarboxylase-like PLP-dependent enzyme